MRLKVFKIIERGFGKASCGNKNTMLAVFLRWIAAHKVS